MLALRFSVIEWTVNRHNALCRRVHLIIKGIFYRSRLVTGSVERRSPSRSRLTQAAVSISPGPHLIVVPVLAPPASRLPFVIAYVFKGRRFRRLAEGVLPAPEPSSRHRYEHPGHIFSLLMHLAIYTFYVAAR
jgi:hypothetical protein